MRSDLPMRTFPRRLLFAGAGIFAALIGTLELASLKLACGAAALEDPGSRSSSIDEVVNEWHGRERRFDSVHLTWHVVRDSAFVPNNYQLEFPAHSTQTETESFWISGHRLRHESRRWYAELEAEIAGYSKENLFSKLVEAMRRGDDDITKWDRPSCQATLVWTEADHRELLDGVSGIPPLGTIRDPSGSLHLCAGNGISPGLMFWPILMAFRPAIAIGDLAPDRLALEEKPVVIGEKRCLVIVGQAGATLKFRLWIDPEQRFAVVRAMAYDNDRVCQQIDVEYAAGNSNEWSPSAWTIMVFNIEEEYPGQSELFRSLRIEVDHQTVNGSVASDLFAVEYPAQTIVNDQLLQRAYVVLEDGKTRPATSRESRILSGRAEPISNSFPALSRNVGFCGAIVVALGVLWALRRRRKSVMTSAPG